MVVDCYNKIDLKKNCNDYYLSLIPFISDIFANKSLINNFLNKIPMCYEDLYILKNLSKIFYLLIYRTD